MEHIEFKQILAALGEWDTPVDFTTPVQPTKNIKRYLDYYGLDFQDVDFHFGSVQANGKKIMVQMHAPKEANVTVLLLHGYFDHAGHLKRIIKYLTDQQKRVIVYDLQGHGLSGGKTLSTKEFTNYGITLKVVIDKIQSQLPRPYYLIGHSTGGAIIVNYLLKKRTHPFEKVIVLAPLIRSNYWWVTVAGYYVLNPFLNKVFRRYRKNSSDKSYLKFVKRDPLQHNHIPIKWLEALIEWNKSIQHAEPSDETLTVLQGNRDQTVDWGYNVKFLKKKFPNADIIQIDQGKHHLFNEGDDVSRDVFQIISDKL
ncbi:alpha/beta fold hydrolase [Pontibacillus yanchengensis]|uniref:Alpha/beta fold hydrolase n=2 Tax=Pontibacillus yanchengensis TaxID=462910 RepID=A0ACC7VBQ1_9BACI|nr:alpha/beta hydrolase [Pontibacillus yanchengensis]MYL34704.1 alpha/beta fold hydrolase [Pontibacillus yanchengensis]MYL52311.1 alpha/beta fold hydrolase [Pontibacillus yanchengensis]